MVAIPLSLNYGKEHCSNIINTIKPDVIVSDDLTLCKDYSKSVAFSLNNIELPADFSTTKEEELLNVELMMCTSGTTGIPKASMFSAEAIQYNVNSISNYFTVNESDTMLICRPIYHCAVLVGELLLSLFVGASIIFYSGGYNPMLIANILDNNNVTVMCGTPTIFKALSDCLRHRHTKGCLRVIAISGEYMLPEYAHKIRDAFPSTKIFNVYGLTEAGPRVSYLPYEMFDETPQAVGKPLRGIEIKIVGEQQEEKECMQPGEIWIKTPSIMLGYYQDIERTNERFYGTWFDTGDIGMIDKNNNLHILGRSDDMIIKSGMNIYPQEIEIKMQTLPDIKEVLVYGKLVNGVEQIAADVVLKEVYKTETSQDIMQKMVRVLPEYMMPTSISIVKDLPKNASGKVVRPRKYVRKSDDSV